MGGRGDGVGKGWDVGGWSCSSALRTSHSAALRAQVLASAEHALGFAHLPDCSLAPYGSSSFAHLQLGSPMC